jgi:hypothetical protein
MLLYKKEEVNEKKLRKEGIEGFEIQAESATRIKYRVLLTWACHIGSASLISLVQSLGGNIEAHDSNIRRLPKFG